MRKILITGAGGFIGFHLCKRLIERGDEIFGIDNMSDYYDAKLKTDRLKQIENRKNFTSLKMDIADRNSIAELFADNKFDIVG